MIHTIDAVFDGTVFRPAEVVELEPNTPVRITIETHVPSQEDGVSFLRTARTLNLDGPPHWSAKIDENFQ